jgi:hypothetical protein
MGLTALLLLIGLLALVGCGSSNSNSSNGSNYATVAAVVSDSPTEDWSVVGVKILNISLVPQSGSPVSIYTAASPVPVTNLVDLDQIGELLGTNTSVPPGTYTGATMTISANQGDVSLVVSPDPDSGFPGTAGATIPSSDINIVGASGGTVTVNLNLVSSMTLKKGQSTPIDLEFDLSNPLLIVEHTTSTGGQTWNVNFSGGNGTVRHHPLADLRFLVLRHVYGQVTSVSSDNSSLTMDRAFPTWPPVSPETAIVTAQAINVNADSTNGTIYYDMDALTKTTIYNFSSIASSLPNKYVRVAARYQSDGSLWAVRVFASSTFNNVYLSPEGHVFHVFPTGDSSGTWCSGAASGTGCLVVADVSGNPTSVVVNSNTNFYFRRPWLPGSENTIIGEGTAFLQDSGTSCGITNLISGQSSCMARGFKVHVNPVNPTLSPLTAADVDIEVARLGGIISNANGTNFTYTRRFGDSSDDYQVALPYATSTMSFVWWNFAYPTLLCGSSSGCGSSAISTFEAATDGAADFGGLIGKVNAWGLSWSAWGDDANSNGWAALFSVLVPTPIPPPTTCSSCSGVGTVSSPPPAAPWASSVTFWMTANGNTGGNSVNVDLSTVTGSATLVFQIQASGTGIITVTPQDITQASVQGTVATALSTGCGGAGCSTEVGVYGVPQPDGSIMAYALFYYTGQTQSPNRRRTTH